MTTAPEGATLPLMEAREHLERIHELQHPHAPADRFNILVAVVVALLAALLAISSIAGRRMLKDAVILQNRAADAQSLAETNTIKRYLAEGNAGILRVFGSGVGSERELVASAAADAFERSAREQFGPAADAAQTANDHYDEQRAVAEERFEAFEIAETALQIAIVMMSIAVISRSRRLIWVCVGLGVVGGLFVLNGFLLIVPLALTG